MIPALGFGTAPIMGRISRRAGVAALERAYAAGIRHFDTARSYGWGEAEKVVGSVLARRPRDDVRLVTKCGIVPARRSPILGAAKSAARWVLSVAPALRSQVARAARVQSFQPTRTYDLEVLEDSLRTSLSELGLAHIDDFLLHNFQPGAPGVEEVVQWFRKLQADRTIGSYGFSIEGDLIEGLSFLADKRLLQGAIVQAPVSDAMLALPQEWRTVRMVAHSPFTFMRRQAETGGKLATLDRLLPALGNACACEALVCSMFAPDHLAENVAAWKSASGER